MRKERKKQLRFHVDIFEPLSVHKLTADEMSRDDKSCFIKNVIDFPPDAFDKRAAWKNSNARRSEKDSLLSSSVDERCFASFELRNETISRTNPSFSHEKDSGNRLRVPSPANKSGFYSTSPSTDEGIGTDDHGQECEPFKPQNGETTLSSSTSRPLLINRSTINSSNSLFQTSHNEVRDVLMWK